MEVVERKSRLKDVDAESVDQIPTDLLSKCRDKKIGEYVTQAWREINANRSELLERQRDYLADWDEFLESDSDGPFKGASTLHLPMPFIVCKTYHARMLQALMADEFLYTVNARRADQGDREPMVAQTMAYALKEWCNQRDGIFPVLDDWVWKWITQGSGVKKWRWEKRYTKFVDSVPQLKMSAPQVRTNPITGVQETFRTPLVDFKDQEVTKKVFEGPCAQVINMEDVGMLGGSGDPQKADITIHREWLTESDLFSLSDQKIFDEEAVEKIIASGDNKVSGATATDIKQDRADNAGLAAIDSEHDQKRFEILEAYLRYDIDGSHIVSDLIVWVHVQTSEVVRATYLHRVSPDGARPIFKIDFHKRDGDEWGRGLPEILHPLSVELDAMHNMRIDFGTISNMPFGFYRPSTTLDAKKIELEPGQLIPIDNPQTDVYFPTLGARQMFGVQEEQAIQVLVERLTGISDLSLGVFSGSQGATRTATGVRGLVQEANANLNVHLMRLNDGWKKSLRYLFHMLQRRIPKGLSFKITGIDGQGYWVQVQDPTQIAGDFDFEVSSNSSQSNPQVREQIANDILQLCSNPLALQLGIVKPQNYFEAMRNYMLAKGEKNFGRYITPPAPGSLWMTPEEEFNRVVRGIPVEVTPQMDHQGYIAYFQHIASEDGLLGQFNEQQVLAAQAQAQKHQQMMQAMEQMANQARNQGQMQMNAAMSQNQAPTAINPLAG